MKRFSSILFLCFALSMMSYAQSVYYYVLEKGRGDGHYIAVNSKSCYDSDAKGCSLSNGLRLYKGEQNNQHLFAGMSVFGDAKYYFSADYSRLKIVVTKSNTVYNYIRVTAPSGALSAHGSVQVPSAGEQPYIPTNTPVAMPGNTQSSYQSTQTVTHRPCSGCGGSGRCSVCNGRGYRKNIYTGSDEPCPWCNGTGQCKVCHGKGHCN